MPSNALPVAFIAHGGGPLPVLSPQRQGGLSSHLKALGKQVRDANPKAILMVSAHWEEAVVSINGDAQPELLYDYGGFEPAAYQLTYRAPGDAALAQNIKNLLRAAGVEAQLKSGRGWDHGVFIPLLLMLAAADIPVVQVSLLRSLDPKAHLKLGQALAPLREQGVFILGSGSSYHNMQGFFGGGSAAALHSKRFHAWLTDAVCTASPSARAALLEKWQDAPSARECHPREEHLIPLHVCAGAAGDDAATRVFDGEIMGAEMASYVFGSWPNSEF